MKVWKVTEEEQKIAKELVAKYLKKHGDKVYTDDVCPVLIYTQRVGGSWYYNPTTGERGHDIYNDIYHKLKVYPQCVRSCSGVNIPYTHFDKDLNVVQFSMATVNTTMAKEDGDIRPYRFTRQEARYFMVNGNKAVYDINGNHINEDRLMIPKRYHANNSYCSRASVKAYFNWMSSNTQYSYNEHHKINRAYGIKGMLDYIANRNFPHNELDRFWQVGYWAIKSDRTFTAKKSEAEKLINNDQITTIHDVSLSKYPITKYEDNTHRYSSIWKDCTLYVFEKISDTVAVFRGYSGSAYQPYDFSTHRYTENIQYYERREWVRIFISNNKIYFYYPNGHHYQPSRDTNISNINWGKDISVNPLQYIPYGKIINMDEVYKFGNFKYYKDIINNIKTTDDESWRTRGQDLQLNRLLTIYKHPEVEALVKMGYINIANYLLENDTVNANIRDYFGKPNAKHKTTWKVLGLNQYQLKMIDSKIGIKDEYGRRILEPNVIRKMKSYYAGNADGEGVDMSGWTAETTKLYYDMYLRFKNITGYYYRYELVVNNLDTTREGFLFSYGREPKTHGDIARMILHAYKLSVKHDPINGPYETISLWSDCVNMCSNPWQWHNEEVPDIDFNFDSKEQIVATHNALIELQTIAQMKADKEKFKKLEYSFKKSNEIRETWEYEDDNYIIKMPKGLGELTLEGNTLHHCVGGYIDSHAHGKTNIMFLRKKSEPDTPWFTIEISPEKSIRQIHGLHNCWLSSTDEGYATIPFILKWLQVKCIHCPNKILLDTGAGYSGNGILREMPQPA